MSDLIDRQAAIDALTHKWNGMVTSVFDVLKELPPEQPKMGETDWIRRSETIEVLENTDWYHQNANKDMVSGANSAEHQAWFKADDIYKAIECLPSAQPERKKGKWVRITQGAMPEQYICPFCHRTVEAYGVEELLSIRYPYCHCGADMRGEQDDTD